MPDEEDNPRKTLMVSTADIKQAIKLPFQPIHVQMFSESQKDPQALHSQHAVVVPKSNFFLKRNNPFSNSLSS